MDRTSWKPKIFKAEEIVDYKAEEGYGIGTPAGDIIWKYFDEVHRMDQDDVHCKICGKMMTEPVRKAGVAGDGMGGLAQQQVYFDHLKQEHGITESKANEDDHKKSWDKLDSIAKQGFSDIGYDQKSWDSEPEEVRAEMETVVKDNLGENWKAVANKIYKEELNKGKKSGGESKGGFTLSWDQDLTPYLQASDLDLDTISNQLKYMAFLNITNYHNQMIPYDNGTMVWNLFDQDKTMSFGVSFKEEGWSHGSGRKRYAEKLKEGIGANAGSFNIKEESSESKANEVTIEEEFDNWDLENTGNPYTLSNWVDYALKDNFNEDEVREFWKKKLDGGWARESKANEFNYNVLIKGKPSKEKLRDEFAPYVNIEDDGENTRVIFDGLVDSGKQELESLGYDVIGESKASEGQLIKIEKNGWEFSVVDHGYGGGWAGTSNTGTYEVGIFEPDDGNPNGQKSEVKGWLTQEEVEDLKRTFEADPVMAYRRIGGDWKESWQDGLESKASEDDLDWTKDKPEGGIPFYCPLCHMTIEENATWDGVFDHNKQIHNMTDENAEILAKGFTYSNSPPTSFESKSTEAYGTCNICHKKMNGTGCVGHFEIDGERYSRIGYGEDGNYDEDGCRDCGVKQFGDKHHWNCDNEKCPACRGQALGCDCDDFELIVDGSESMTQMDDSSDSPSTINAARKMMKGQLDSYNDNPTPEGDQYGTPQGFPWQYGGENDFSKKYSYLDKPQVKDEIMPMVDLYHGGQRIGHIRDYNPMGHLGLVTMDAIGIEEYGALPSDYEAYINGKRIPNKWDNQVDHNASFFGENDMKDYEKYDDWDDESEVRNTESWGHWTDNEPMKSHDQVKLMKDLGIADKTLRQMGYLHKDGVEGFIERIEKELSKFGINLDKDKDQVEESKTSAGQLGGGSYLSDSVEDHLDIGIDRWTGKIHREANEDSLIKIEDDKDEDTQVTVLDEWKNETDPDVNGETKGIRTTKASEDASDQCPYCEGKGCEDCLQTGLIDGKLRDVRYPELKTSEGFDQGLYGHVDAKCKTCGIEFDSIPDMDDHYAMHSDHISNLDDLDSNIPNSD
jgi:hypothetical protein